MPDAHEHVRANLKRLANTRLVRIPPIGDHEVTLGERDAPEVLPAASIGELDGVHSTRREVIAGMESPIGAS